MNFFIIIIIIRKWKDSFIVLKNEKYGKIHF